MNNHLVTQSSTKSKDDLICLWRPKRNQSIPLGASDAQKTFTNGLKMKKLWLPKMEGSKKENAITLGSLFLNIQKVLGHCSVAFIDQN
jgi:hypothetical protein